jgi:hypothetical protein
MDTAKGSATVGLPSVHMATAKGMTLSSDIIMDTARSGTTLKNGNLQLWERELLESSEVRRKSTVAQLCTWYHAKNSIRTDLHLLDFLDYYFQLLGYINARKERRTKFDEDTASRNLAMADYNREFKSYCGRERVLLRRRRAKLRVEQFHIIAQVGQGGYGEVYLARKQETGEVCALKKMRKRTLFKMDEVPTFTSHYFFLTRSLPGQTRPCRTRYPHCDKNALAGPSALCVPRRRACLPRDGVCAWGRLSHITE